MLNDEKNALQRALLVLVGQIICGIGVGLFLFSGLGPDPNSVFISGVGFRLNLSYGMASFLCNGIILIMIYFIDKFYIHFASVLALVSVGFTADFTRFVLGSLLNITLNNFFIKLIFNVLGGVVLGLGITIYVSQNLGIAPFDGISEIISRKKNISISIVRRIIDITMLILGYLLGGTFGIGTIILAFLVGPSIGFWRDKLKLE